MVSLPEHFRTNGYRTVSVGKVYHRRDDDLPSWSEPPWRASPNDDNWQGYASAETSELRQRLLQEARVSNPDTQFYQINAGAVERAYLPDDRYRDGRIAARGRGRAARERGRPVVPGRGFRQAASALRGAGEILGICMTAASSRRWENTARPDGSTGIPYIYSELESYRGIPTDTDPSREQVLELIHGYYAAVSFVDAQVGKLLDELDRSNLREKTVVALLGDHGFHLGEQGIWAKHSLFELSLHTPLIVSAPGAATQGRVVKVPVELVDVYPSLIELAGLAPSPRFDGESLAPLMANPDTPWREGALSQYRHFRGSLSRDHGVQHPNGAVPLHGLGGYPASASGICERTVRFERRGERDGQLGAGDPRHGEVASHLSERIDANRYPF